MKPKPRITRSRTGCTTCRQRHTKCDEARPHCNNCIRLGFSCPGYTPLLQFVNAAVPTRRRRSGRRRTHLETSADADSQGGRPSRADDASPNDNVSLVGSFSHCATTAASTVAEPGDVWVSANFPSQLPAIFRAIWETIGYSHTILKYAVLAHSSAVLPSHGESPIAEAPPKAAMAFYSSALRALSAQTSGSLCPFTSSLHDVVVFLTILVLLQMYEMKHGTFLGGITHCKQVEKLISEHLDQLRGWETARRLLRAWVPLKCWFSFQCAPWISLASPFPPGARQDLWDILCSPSDRTGVLVPLLCESRRRGTQLLLSRLLGPDETRPEYAKFLNNLDSFAQRGPQDGVYGTESSDLTVMSELEALREKLDWWHESQSVDELPLIRATSYNNPALLPRNSHSCGQPLIFRSNQAAVDFLRYAAAQELVSAERLDFLLGRSPPETDPKDRWVILILQAISGLDLNVPLEEHDVFLGIPWILLYGVVLRRPRLGVLEWLRQIIPRLEGAGNQTYGLCPYWGLKSIISTVLEEKLAGRTVLFIWTDASADNEISDTRAPTPMRVLIVGVETATGNTFQSFVNVPAQGAS